MHCSWISSICRPIPNQLYTVTHWSHASNDHYNHLDRFHWSCAQSLHSRMYGCEDGFVQDLIWAGSLVTWSGLCPKCVFVYFAVCVMLSDMREWEDKSDLTDGSAVMVEADNGSSCCVWGFPPHSSSWMFPLTSDLSTVWSDTSFHRMIAETFSSVPGATADASAVSISRRREKKTRTYSVQNDETDGIFPCEQVRHLPFYSRGGDELYILWMLLCFWEEESAIQVMLSCGPPGSRPVWQTHAHITPTGTRPGAVSSKGHFQNTAVWCIFLNSKI